MINGQAIVALIGVDGGQNKQFGARAGMSHSQGLFHNDQRLFHTRHGRINLALLQGNGSQERTRVRHERVPFAHDLDFRFTQFFRCRFHLQIRFAPFARFRGGESLQLQNVLVRLFTFGFVFLSRANPRHDCFQVANHFGQSGGLVLGPRFEKGSLTTINAHRFLNARNGVIVIQHSLVQMSLAGANFRQQHPDFQPILIKALRQATGFTQMGFDAMHVGAPYLQGILVCLNRVFFPSFRALGFGVLHEFANLFAGFAVFIHGQQLCYRWLYRRRYFVLGFIVAFGFDNVAICIAGRLRYFGCGSLWRSSHGNFHFKRQIGFIPGIKRGLFFRRSSAYRTFIFFTCGFTERGHGCNALFALAARPLGVGGGLGQTAKNIRNGINLIVLLRHGGFFHHELFSFDTGSGWSCSGGVLRPATAMILRLVGRAAVAAARFRFDFSCIILFAFITARTPFKTTAATVVAYRSTIARVHSISCEDGNVQDALAGWFVSRRAKCIKILNAGWTAILQGIVFRMAALL
mmetsp:Transcript_12745/g.26438  ORF Transcript_12745/g.26438 Transcript_12745/m.26438 type:complete len:520 (-) Transcript_12745:73-1632(-)